METINWGHAQYAYLSVRLMYSNNYAKTTKNSRKQENVQFLFHINARKLSFNKCRNNKCFLLILLQKFGVSTLLKSFEYYKQFLEETTAFDAIYSSIIT